MTNGKEKLRLQELADSEVKLSRALKVKRSRDREFVRTALDGLDRAKADLRGVLLGSDEEQARVAAKVAARLRQIAADLG